MKRSIASTVTLALILATGTVYAEAPDNKAAKNEAVDAATKWLGLVDAGKYADSWKEAAGYFKAAITKAQWEQALKASRKPLGAMVSRKLLSAEYKTALPGAPDGEYVVIQFTTSFENKQEAVETITPMKEKDGKWRVSGYFIR
ncbi:MAG: DUF4019 domain-containing protein [Myxococcota bacterium]